MWCILWVRRLYRVHILCTQMLFCGNIIPIRVREWGLIVSMGYHGGVTEDCFYIMALVTILH
jgi:hypothetical protein